MHELLWTRRLIDLLGASAASSTRVFSCFFLGLALGAAVTPRLARRMRRPWRAVALAELGVAVLALPALCLPQWSGWIWPALGAARLVAWEGATTKFLLSAIAVLPPAFCMGMVLPLMAHAVLRGRFELARHGVWLYAINTLGGVLGLGTVSLLTLHLVGAGGSMLLAVTMNLLVAAGGLVLDARCPPTTPASDAAFQQQTVSWSVFLPALTVAMVSGMGILAFEVLALQLVALSAPLSFYAPTAVLTVVVLLLGLAALVVPLLAPRVGGAQRVLSLGLSGTAICMAGAPLYFFQLVQWVDLGQKDTLFAFLAVLLGVAMVALGPAVLLAGLVFPAVLAWLGTIGQDRYGHRWGWLLAVNGLGGLIGAEATYRFVLPTAGVHQAMGCVATLYAVAALAWALSRVPRTITSLVWPLGITAAVVVVTLGPLSWLPQVNPEGVIIVDQRSGREGTVAVVDSPNMGRRIIMSNQYVLGGTKFRFDQERLTHLPLLLHPDPQRVACIGLATGITPGAALEQSAVAAVTAVELSPLVVRAADQYFGPFNHDITRSDRAWSWWKMPARTWRPRRASLMSWSGTCCCPGLPEKLVCIVWSIFAAWRSAARRRRVLSMAGRLPTDARSRGRDSRHVLPGIPPRVPVSQHVRLPLSGSGVSRFA